MHFENQRNFQKAFMILNILKAVEIQLKSLKLHEKLLHFHQNFQISLPELSNFFHKSFSKFT